jgi:ATP-binding cassette subfamily B protein
VQTVVVGRNGERLLYTLRVKIFAHLQRLGLDFYERELSGRIMTRMTTDVDALSSFLQTGLITMVNSLLTFTGVMIALLFINARLGLTLFAIIPVLAVVTVVFRIRSSRAYTEARERVSVVNADFQENVAGLRITQAYRRAPRNAARFAGLSTGYRQSRLRAQRYIALYFPFVQLLSTVAAALVLFTAAGQVHSGALTAGGLVAFLLYIDLLFAPVQQLSQVFDGYQQASVGLRRIKDLLRTATSTPQAERPRRTATARPVEFRDAPHSGPVTDALNGSGGRARRDRGASARPAPSHHDQAVAWFYDVTGGQVPIDGPTCASSTWPRTGTGSAWCRRSRT